MTFMGKPAVDIEVDDETGRWRVDSLPVILVPQHFLLNNHFALEAALGPDRLAEILRPSGFLSAHQWCAAEAVHHGLSPVDTFHHYLRRLSQRGWGLFRLLALDVEGLSATVRIDHSAFVVDRPEARGRCVCGMFGPWLEGALCFAAQADASTAELHATEVQCAAQAVSGHCLFQVDGPARTS